MFDYGRGRNKEWVDTETSPCIFVSLKYVDFHTFRHDRRKQQCSSGFTYGDLKQSEGRSLVPEHIRPDGAYSWG